MRPRYQAIGRGCASALAACSCVVLIAVAAAQQAPRAQTGIDLRMSERLGRQPAAVAPVQGAPDAGRGETRLRGVTLHLASGVLFDGNVRRTSIDERRDSALVLQPSVYLDSALGRHHLRVGYEGDYAHYNRVGALSYDDHGFLSTLHLDLGRRLKGNVESSLVFGHDEPGALDTRRTLFGDPDRWREHRLGATVEVGRRIAKAQVGAGYDIRGLRYLNNSQSGRDLDARRLRVFGRYSLGPRYAVIGEVARVWTDYLDPTSPLDSRETIALIGLEWEATAKTSGEIRIGSRWHDYDDPGAGSVDGFTWDARVFWDPKTYSRVTAYTSREVTDSAFGRGPLTSTATVDVYGARWRHGLTRNLTFDAGAERSVADYEGAGDDRFFSMDAGLRYRLNRWVDLVANWTFDSRSSPVPGNDFESHVVFVGFDSRLDHPFGR